MEQLNKVDVVRSSLEVVLQKDIDGRFKDKGIVDSNASNPWLLI